MAIQPTTGTSAPRRCLVAETVDEMEADGLHCEVCYASTVARRKGMCCGPCLDAAFAASRARGSLPQQPAPAEFVGASPAAVLRALLPEAKRICSRQHRSAVWDALLAAEQLLAEVDARREAWARAAENVADVLSPVPEPGVAEEAGP